MKTANNHQPLAISHPQSWLLLLIAYGLSLMPCFSQDIHFSQLSETPLLLNPANTGVFEGFYRASLNYKNQWASMGGPYNTMLASFDMPLLKGKKNGAYLGLGAFFYSDRAGDAQLGTTSANLSVAGIVPLDKSNTLSAGLQFGGAQRKANLSSIQFPNQYNGQSYDSNIPSNETNTLGSFTYFDMSSGLNYRFFKKDDDKNIFRFNVGAAYFHLNQPMQKFYSGISDKLYGKIVLNSQLRYDIPKTKTGILFSAAYFSQGRASEIDFGGGIRYKLAQGTKFTGFLSESAISGEVFYRLNDAIIPQLFFELSNYAIGISYDVNVSGLSTATRKAGGFEISLKYFDLKDALFQGGK